MAEQVMKHIRLDDVVKLLGFAYPVRHRELAVGQQGKKRHFRYQPRHRHQLPTRSFDQPFVHIVKARDVGGIAQRRQGGNELVTCQAGQQFALPCVQKAVGVVVSLGIGGVVLRAGVVGLYLATARVVSAWWAVAASINDRFNGHASSCH